MLTLSFNFFAFPCECNEAVEKIQKLFSFGGWRKEQGRGRGAIFDQTEKNRIIFLEREISPLACMAEALASSLA